VSRSFVAIQMMPFLDRDAKPGIEPSQSPVRRLYPSISLRDADIDEHE